MPNKWIIKDSKDVKGGKDRADLVGCFITINVVNGVETAYVFNSPNPNSQPLAMTQTQKLPPVPFSFPKDFGPYQGLYWTVTVNTLTGGHSQKDAEGTWGNNDPSLTNDETGTFTAQSDATVDPYDEAADAASASAGSK